MGVLPPEAPLWNHLDACGIPFRTASQDLIAEFGTFPLVWTPSLDACSIEGKKPFIPNLANPLTFKLHKGLDPDSPPTDFSTAVQATDDHRLNFAKAISGLRAAFGPGDVASASNTVARRWRFGWAEIRCTTWPPENQDNRGLNSRHKMFPETITEAQISVIPGWRPPLTDQEAAWCRTAQALAPELPGPQEHPFRPIRPQTRDWPDGVQAFSGPLALSEDKAAILWHAAPGLINIVPVAVCHSLHLDRIEASRSSAAASLMIHFEDLPSRTTGRTRRIVSRGGALDGLDALAEDLAKATNLPLTSYTGPMD